MLYVAIIYHNFDGKNNHSQQKFRITLMWESDSVGCSLWTFKISVMSSFYEGIAIAGTRPHMAMHTYHTSLQEYSKKFV